MCHTHLFHPGSLQKTLQYLDEDVYRVLSTCYTISDRYKKNFFIISESTLKLSVSSEREFWKCKSLRTE